MANLKKQSDKISLQSSPSDYADDRTIIQRNFKQLRIRLTIGLLIGFMLPHGVLAAYFHFQFNYTLKKTGNFNLRVLSESQRNTIDLFLQERVVNLFSLFHSNEFSFTPAQYHMKNYLHNLRQVSDAFIDVGFLTENGIQIGYAGPFPNLQDKDYSNEDWFKTLLNHEKDYFISDIYLGFRNKPHFTIATRQMIDGKYYIMRSTLDPDKFYMFLRTQGRGKEVEFALINNKGLYQIVDPDRGNLLGMSDFIPPETEETGVQEIKKAGNSVLIAHTWLKETHWALLVRQPLSIVHAQMYSARRILMISSAIILIMISAIIWFLISRFVGQAQQTAESQLELRHQLIHASKLASVGELATGVAHEINNPLAIIIATSGVIRDMLNPGFNMNAGSEDLRKELDVIDSAAFRARGITRQLLDFGRKNEPKLVPCNVNKVLDNVLHGFKAQEFKVAEIEIKRKYTPDLPDILVDIDQIQQVFLNLINNAGDAIVGPGTITIYTGIKNDHLHITIEDTGVGISPDKLEKIFDPFYTTKEVGKGTGLGLSVSLNIVESMGGSINVQSIKGVGSSFTVSLPIKSS